LIMDFFPLIILMRCKTCISLHMLNHHCLSEIKSTCPWNMIFSVSCRIQFISILFWIFVPMFLKKFSVQLSFLVCPLLWYNALIRVSLTAFLSFLLFCGTMWKALVLVLSFKVQ
jgi:hypothetical protein